MIYQLLIIRTPKEYKQLFYSEFHEATQSWQILSHNFLLFICKHTKKFEKWIYDAMIFLGIRNRSFFFICSKPKICRTVFFAVVTSVVLWDGFDINQSFLIFSSPIFFSSVVSHSYYHFLMPKKVYVVSLAVNSWCPSFSLVLRSFRDNSNECTFRREDVFILKITHSTLVQFFNFNRQVSIIWYNLRIEGLPFDICLLCALNIFFFPSNLRLKISDVGRML